MTVYEACPIKSGGDTQLAFDLRPPRPECRICGEPFPDRAPSTGSHWECEAMENNPETVEN